MREKLFQWKLRKMVEQGERYKKEKIVRDAYAQYVPDRKKKKVSNIMLVVVVVATTLYAIAGFWLTYVTGVNIDSTLTTCFYALWAGELLGLVTIKVGKVIKNKDNGDDFSDYASIYTRDCDDSNDMIE